MLLCLLACDKVWALQRVAKQLLRIWDGWMWSEYVGQLLWMQDVVLVDAAFIVGANNYYVVIQGSLEREFNIGFVKLICN